MAPVKKRARRIEEKAGEESDVVAADNSKGVAVSEMDTVFEEMFSQIKKIVESNDSDAVESVQSSLLVLKGMQRDMLDQLNRSAQSMQEQKTQLARKERQLAGLKYERNHLQREIEGCNNFTMPHLETLAAAEDGDLADRAAGVRNFLQADVADPTNRQSIIAKLHQELNARGGLERDLKTKQKELEGLMKKLKQKKDFLASLPDHLASMERASLPLQKFIHQQPGTVVSSKSLRMIGSERRARLDLAQSLPGPLYVLFESLQQFVDKEDVAPHGLSVSVSRENEQQVLLHVPVPDVSVSSSSSAGTSGTRSKRVVLHFSYIGEAAVVTVAASGCGSTLNQDILLDELFPGDVTNEVIGSGKPYHWCNYLAGIQNVTEDFRPASTRVVIRELRRRVRANATLKLILNSLGRCIVPSLRVAEEESQHNRTTCKLTGFVKNHPEDEGPEQTYNVSIRRGASNLPFTVTINRVRYPIIPPVWTLNNTSDPDTLYDEGLALLERRVNSELLDEPIQQEDSDYGFEWILVRQLQEILVQADILGQADSGKAATRSIRGRDRVPVGCD